MCTKLAELIQRDAPLLEEVVRQSIVVDSDGDAQLEAQLAQVKRHVVQCNAKISDLADLAGQGSDEARAMLKSKVRAAQAELAALSADKARLEALANSRRRLTPDDARRILAELCTLLLSAAEGLLGKPAVYRALSIFKALTAERLEVDIEVRPGRKQTVVRATFELRLLEVVFAQRVAQLCRQVWIPISHIYDCVKCKLWAEFGCLRASTVDARRCVA